MAILGPDGQPAQTTPTPAGASHERAWTMLRVHGGRINPGIFVAPGLTVAGKFPRGLFAVIFDGMRSDGIPVSVQAHMDGKHFKTNPDGVFEMLSGLSNQFHTYLNCDCQKGFTCALHQMPEKVPSPDAEKKVVPFQHVRD